MVAEGLSRVGHDALNELQVRCRQEESGSLPKKRRSDRTKDIDESVHHLWRWLQEQKGPIRWTEFFAEAAVLKKGTKGEETEVELGNEPDNEHVAAPPDNEPDNEHVTAPPNHANNS